MTIKTYRAEFFTTADYAIRNFEAKTPEQALDLARRFYEDNIIDLDFRSYDDIEPLDQIEVWDQKTGKRASWQSDEALIGFQGDGLGHVTRAAMSARSSALPRRRALCTN